MHLPMPAIPKTQSHFAELSDNQTPSCPETPNDRNYNTKFSEWPATQGNADASMPKPLAGSVPKGENGQARPVAGYQIPEGSHRKSTTQFGQILYKRPVVQEAAARGFTQSSTGSIAAPVHLETTEIEARTVGPVFGEAHRKSKAESFSMPSPFGERDFDMLPGVGFEQHRKSKTEFKEAVCGDGNSKAVPTPLAPETMTAFDIDPRNTNLTPSKTKKKTEGLWQKPEPEDPSPRLWSPDSR
ncbi:hypothetical protein CTRI78_v008610 [Colletotrichum trifolii]|uniref:Uncharacterized protein n=1 Tax=Colletotrichum trifolii TaxID=5466 RepID=A0A4R8QT92_COLTR|nr:hypothetical protein CTRI78_v008610 [Colletotrichum trifolii]